MSRYTKRRRRIEAFLAAAGAACAAVMLQPANAPKWRLVFAALAAALPLLVIHERHGQQAAEPPRLVQ